MAKRAKLVDTYAVLREHGISRSTLYRWRAAGLVPAPAERRTVWVLDDGRVFDTWGAFHDAGGTYATRASRRAFYTAAQVKRIAEVAAVVRRCETLAEAVDELGTVP